MRVDAGRRLIESPQYRQARESGAFKSRHPGARDGVKGIEVLSNAELVDMLRARQAVGLLGFDIEGVPFPSELPVATNLPAVVETIPTEHLQVELAPELSEDMLATAVPYGTPLREGSATWGPTPALQPLYRFGNAQPVSLGVLDDPGAVASLLNRRLRGGVNLGLENDLINGNGYWPGMLANAGDTNAKGVSYRAFAIRQGIANVQSLGWYVRPLQVMLHPTTACALFEEEDGSQRPLNILEMFKLTVDTWITSKFMPVGQALVGDFFEAVGLFVHGGLEVDLSRNHMDFLSRGLVEMKIEFRTYAWVRNTSALDLVTGL
jgi:hypothetical protein